jgi:hypothetical protein
MPRCLRVFTDAVCIDSCFPWTSSFCHTRTEADLPETRICLHSHLSYFHLIHIDSGPDSPSSAVISFPKLDEEIETFRSSPCFERLSSLGVDLQYPREETIDITILY